MSITFKASKRVKAIELVDELIRSLTKACQQLQDAKNPELVELNQTLIKARYIRKVLINENLTFQQWKSFSDSVLYLIEVTTRLYSFFISYTHKIISKYEARENNKIITYCRRSFANFSGSKA